MNIKTLNTGGFETAILAMRNPMNSWDKSDSKLIGKENSPLWFEIGENDKELSIKLQKAGPEHCKHLRMIYVWAEINAPRFWWNEFDTYRFGVDKVSCSTMHKLMARPLTEDDFEHDCIDDELFKLTIERLNLEMKRYKLEQDPEEKKKIWRGIIEFLPQSYLQKRTVCMSYASIRNIVKQREGHKLVEWSQFIDWAHALKNSWMIFE